LGDTAIETNLDPHLQDVLLAQESGAPLFENAVAAPFEGQGVVVDVIAKLANPAEPVPGLEVVRTIGDIVTGTVGAADIESVRAHPNVMSLKRATELHADLEFSVPEIEAAQDALAAAFPGDTVHDGHGVIVGIVDYGCDFVHGNFRHPDGSTRLLFLWDQRGPETSISPAGYGYGREFATTAINNALRAAAPGVQGQAEDPERAYQVLAYKPEAGAHGTHVMDIAAGNGTATSHRGVAPAADLIFVQPAAADFEDEESIGNSRRMLEAVDYIFNKAMALGRPAVINISLGTHGGPHDGSTLVEQGLDTLAQQQPGRAIVISAGNSRMRRSHASGTVTAAATRTLTWEITSGDKTGNELEVWYDGQLSLAVTVVSPAGTRLGPIFPGNTQIIQRQGVALGRIIHRQGDPNNGDNQIDVLLSKDLPAGNWQIELSTEGAAPVAFHAWIERDDAGQSGFAAADDDRTHTIGSISCGAKTIVVGSYNARVPARDLAQTSGEGPTRDGKHKPEVSAPGMQVRAAKALSQASITKSGTSMAAPHVTGLIALLLQAAAPLASVDDLRAVLLGHCRRTPSGATAWGPGYGEGRVTCLATLRARLGLEAISGPLALPQPEEQPQPAMAVRPDGAAAPAPEIEGQLLAQLISTLSRAATKAQARVRV
jgi:subtilisin family serine protease